MLQPSSEGLVFGKYQLLERIATGGMAEIYRARMQAAAGVTKSVVIKKILPGFADNSTFVSMFVNEARIAVGLSHGNIAQVFDFGEVDGQYFLAMEWVDGPPLSRVLRRAREKGLALLPQPLSLLVGLEVLEGLAYAHTRLDEQGRPLHIIHRDVSPQNVLLSYEGQVKLVDFGIARARLASRVETESHAVQGKYAYFAPEQARGRELDARADIFAVGTLLYEMLCGRRPFEGRREDVLRKIALGDFPRPRDLNSDVPPALERILLTAMAVEREQRYASAETFAEALTHYLHTEAPDVGPSVLGHFMAWLFEPELVAEGRPVLLTREFLAQLERWNRGPRSAVDPPVSTATEPTDAGATPGSGHRARTTRPTFPASSAEDTPAITDRRKRTTQPSLPAVSAVDAPSVADPAGTGHRKRTTQPVPVVSVPETSSEPRSASTPGAPLADPDSLRSPVDIALPRWAVLGAPALAALVASAAVLMASSTGTFSVELSSTPPGALVRVDGQLLPTRTPTLITQLNAGGDHLLEVQLQGMIPWNQTVSAERGTTLAVHAHLRPRPVTDATRPLAPAGTATTRGATPRWTRSALEHAFLAPRASAAHLRLDPEHSYVLHLEEGTSRQGAMTERVAYHLEGGPTLPESESFGLMGTDEQTVRHAFALHLLVLDAEGPDDLALFRVRVRDQSSGAVTTLELSPRRHALASPPHGQSSSAPVRALGAPH